MKSDEQLIIGFHRALFGWAERWLNREYDSGFQNLKLLDIPSCDLAVKYLIQLDVVNFRTFVPQLVRRCYQQELLKWFDEADTMADDAILARFSLYRKDERRAPARPERIHFSSIEKAELIRGFKARHPTAKKMFGGMEYIEEIDAVKVHTYLDSSHNKGGISYGHRAVIQGGVQLNVIPLSVLSLCGISSETKWRDHSKLTVEGLLSVIDSQSTDFFEFLRAEVKS